MSHQDVLPSTGRVGQLQQEWDSEVLFVVSGAVNTTFPVCLDHVGAVVAGQNDERLPIHP